MGDRFQLRVHRENKEMPVYALVVSKSGPKIVKTSDGYTQESALSLRRSAGATMELKGVQSPPASTGAAVIESR